MSLWYAGPQVYVLVFKGGWQPSQSSSWWYGSEASVRDIRENQLYHWMSLISGSFGFSTTEKEVILVFVPVIMTGVLSFLANTPCGKFCFWCKIKHLPFGVCVINKFYFCQLNWCSGLAQIWGSKRLEFKSQIYYLLGE